MQIEIDPSPASEPSIVFYGSVLEFHPAVLPAGLCMTSHPSRSPSQGAQHARAFMCSVFPGWAIQLRSSSMASL